MKTVNEARKRLEALLRTPGAELGRWGRFLRFQVQLWRTCARRLREHNAMAMSSALSFRTIFALIPILVLSLLVAKSVGVLEDEQSNLRMLLEKAGFELIRRTSEPGAVQTLPATAAATQPIASSEMFTVADRIERIVLQAAEKLTFKRIGPVGAAVLIWTAMTLLTTMERSLNRIFGAPRSRALGRRILLYWSAMTLGPIFLGVAVYGAGKAHEALATVPVLGWIVGAVGWAGSVIIGVVLLAALYKLMPNTSVRYSAAVGGAIVAVPLWLVAKWAFGFYVQHASTNIYGALGLLPLFLFWVNLSWMIFLFGAELAHTAVNLEEMATADMLDRAIVGPEEVMATVSAVAIAHESGDGPLPLEQAARRAGLPQVLAGRILDRLVESRVIAVTADDPPAYLMARAPAKVTLQALQALGADASGRAFRPGDRRVAAAVDRLRERTGAALGETTLAETVGEISSK